MCHLLNPIRPMGVSGSQGRTVAQVLIKDASVNPTQPKTRYNEKHFDILTTSNIFLYEKLHKTHHNFKGL